MTLPRSTLRLQLHRGFTFDDAAAHVDYFAALGISHLYLSPLTTAVPGSTHGYDTVDYGTVSPELGGEPALRRLSQALRARQMGIIADIVPNHMGIACGYNAWWFDILEWGRHSAYARYFDVDWHSPDPALRGKVLAPCLGAQYGEELAAGRIALAFDETLGRIVARYAEHVFPICPVDYPVLLRTQAPGDERSASERAALAEHFDGLTPQPEDRPRAQAALDALRTFAAEQGQPAIEAALAAYSPATPASRDRLHRLLERQFYRLAWWRTASDEVNWRRFFDISTLAAIRTERVEVFDAAHGLILQLFAQGIVDGVRIDHIDGLLDPRDYCHRLRERLAEREAQRPPQIDGTRAYLVVEKILAPGETLPADWNTDGTTGYDFMNEVGALLHDARGEAPLTAAWNDLAGSNASYEDEARAARRLLLAENFSAELDRAARALHRMAREHPATRDFAFAAIRRALTELAVHFPVYRLYPNSGVRTSADEPYFRHAYDQARAALPAADHAVLEQVDRWLGASADGAEPPSSVQGAGGPHGAAPNRERRTASAVFAQLTAPLAAKALEDTAFYRYGRLLSRNEVGSAPNVFSLSVEQFHAANAERAKRFAHGLLTTATHDHKRGEDVRARLAVLSELADEWCATLRAWSTLNAPQRRALTGGSLSSAPLPGSVTSRDWAPGPTAEAMLYQTLIGCWPYELDPSDADGVEAFAQRIAAWQLKALREAKLRTSWHAPDETYESASREFLFDILSPQRRDGFLHELTRFVARVARAGAVNSLLQTVLRITSPGVPDLYQGTELWDFSLVDPDNRRPVDFARRKAALTDAPPSDHLASWRDARVKLGIVQRALTLRAHSPALFLEGDYEPLPVTGNCAEHAIAFARRHGDAYAIVIGTRLAASLLSPQSDVPLVDPALWEDTSITLPPTLASRTLFDWFSPAAPKADANGRLLLSEALSALPVALLVEEGVR
ncbi:malto-oligosyltrehalose synthase [Trinickia caryophylli]|uniref:Maltooligosyl trehalose synthase n=1 Tax=Trinickia caryophylli TaxID=28094 RepID=A0A1X7EHE5_TRICW|nr:malto-oligosyltrehalose synthase [Trinickia caryophylli]PMS11056.1 malto-oligosyltrehalose synthase [Trinickia caryophylli]TRX14512.1 malto-oligosyltrehalose synthase [Trinickia caryophylli]WQE14352.1 malto-oligosyltrehalose synthase [Trinickia caryophylli]SMF33622.1 maltooligosyl trehalose synthase [Trinickia caryophylli]GLU32261.1 malto-oligosyltrehalose synthase [Trinickia caryophylli]